MTDQAQNLREFVRKNRSIARVLAVTSGKGGAGKTTVSVNLAIALAAQRRRVVVLDGDLGLANVEVLMGLNSLYNLQHVIEGEKSITEILVKGPGGIEVVPGSSGLAKMADLGPVGRQNLLDSLKDLQEKSDFIIIDTMAGIGRNAVSFAAAADEILLVTTPEPSAVVDGYAMVKAIHAQRDDAVFRLIVNMVSSRQQAAAVTANLSQVAQQYLGCNLASLGYIVRDPHVAQGVMQTRPFLLQFPNAPASCCIREIAARIIHQQIEAQRNQAGFFRRFAQTFGLANAG